MEGSFSSLTTCLAPKGSGFSNGQAKTCRFRSLTPTKCRSVFHTVAGTGRSWSTSSENAEASGMTAAGTDDYKAGRCAREKSGGFRKGSVGLDYNPHSEFAGVSPANSMNAFPLPLFSTYDTGVTLNGDGCPAQLRGGVRTWGGRGRQLYPHTVASRSTASSNSTALSAASQMCGPPWRSPGDCPGLVYRRFY